MKNKLILILLVNILFPVIATAQNSWDWVKTPQMSGPESQTALATAIATDANGNVYVSCDASGGTITFDGQSFTNSVQYALKYHLLKYDSAGNLLWAKNNAVDNKSHISALATDAAGNVYALGSFFSTITFGDITLFTLDNSTTNLFLAKFDSNGNVMWVKEGIPSLATNGVSPTDIALDTNGNIYITGTEETGTLTFGDITLSVGGLGDVFIVKYDTNGNALWGKTGHGLTYGSPSVATDSNNNVYLTGSYVLQTMTFGNIAFTNTGTLSAYLLKYDTNGNSIWSKSFNGGSHVYASPLAIDAQNNIYVGGKFNNPSLSIGNIELENEHPGDFDIFIAKFDANGNAAWAKSVGGEDEDFVTSLATDADNNVYMTANFISPEIEIGGQTIINETVEGTNGFVTKLDQSGNYLSTEHIGGNLTNSNRAIGLAIGTGDDIFVAGNYNNATFGEVELTSTQYNMFLAKLSLGSLEQNEFMPTANAIFPNPATTVLNIKTDKPVSGYSIFDLTGRTVISGKLNNDAAINISHLPSGLYILNCDNGINTKFVKE